MIKKIVLLASASSFIATSAMGDERVPPITDPIVKKECGACHIAYQPRLLPRQSWEKIMSGLQDHFGEDASLDEKTADHITTYLTDNSRNSKRNRAPLRISELGWFVDEHRHEVSEAQKKKAGTMSNCSACHRGAEQGNYDDD